VILSAESVVLFSFWGLRPQTPTRAPVPGPHWGTSVLQTPTLAPTNASWWCHCS